MKYITHLILALLASNSLAGIDTPKTDSLSDYRPSYMYIYPEVKYPTCNPTRYPPRKWLKEKNEVILAENGQNALFYSHFKERAKKDNAYIYNTWKLCHNMGSGLSRTVLNISVLASIERILKDQRSGLDGLFMNYSHADDYSLLGTPSEEMERHLKRTTAFSRPLWPRINGWIDSDFSDYNRYNASKRSERLYVLDRLQKMGAKVYIYNKFYNVPDYIKNHENVEMLKDKDAPSKPDWTPDYYSWTNKQGRKINAGFLHLPYDLNKMSTLGDYPANCRGKSVIALKHNDRVFNLNVETLSADSQKLAARLIGPYPYSDHDDGRKEMFDYHNNSIKGGIIQAREDGNEHLLGQLKMVQQRNKMLELQRLRHEASRKRG